MSAQAPELLLYHAWASTCSQKVRLALAEKSLAWQGRVLSLRQFEHLSDEFLALNPDGMVPVLVHQGFVIRESSVINDYLDEVFPQPALRLPGPQGRARVAMWSRFVDEVTSPAIKKPSFMANLRPYLQSLPEAELARVAGRFPSRAIAQRWLQAAREGIAEGELQASLSDLRRSLDRAQAALRDGPWLAGEHYTLADVNMIPFVLRMDQLPGFDLGRDWPEVRDWMLRVTQRPAFDKAQFVEQQANVTA